jgi:hypothetical protein
MTSVGWESRDWAKWTEEERSSYLGTGGGARRPSGFGVRPGATLAVAVSAALTLVTSFVRGHSIVPLPLFRHPAAPQAVALTLDRTIVDVGTGVSFRGSRPGRDGSLVLLDGSLDGGPWRRVASAIVSNGRYELSARFTERGRLALRLTVPGGPVARGFLLVR